MSVLIKGMEMPTSCDDCFLPLKYCPYAMKPNGECPLVPVPPHGRLIDADALERDLRKNAKDAWYKETSPISWSDSFYELADMVSDAPTIIPASEEGDL